MIFKIRKKYTLSYLKLISYLPGYCRIRQRPVNALIILKDAQTELGLGSLLIPKICSVKRGPLEKSRH